LTFEIDPIHSKIDIMSSKMVYDIWNDKYRWKAEADIKETFARVANAIYENDDAGDHKKEAFEAMSLGLWIPGGRILAGAGTEKRVTLMNCYVNEVVGDDMEGIMHALTNTALTLQQGGGIGTDFSTLRPEGAILKRTHTKASGPLPFMHMWDRASATIRSAGDRRGAMMATMCDTHPDMPKFVVAKHVKNALEQFNVSVLISDAFMEAVKEDEEWLLHFNVPPLERDSSLEAYDFEDEESGEKRYVYSVHQARALWKLITESTYDYSEPGVIFIDRVNDLNNLYYCETITCTNPCGEQPLPPHGTCNLGHINLARCVHAPFSSSAKLDYNLIRQVVRMGIRFLDNVIDITRYPLDEQALEESNKRRLGLGFTGLADCLAQLGVRYGSPDAVRITEEINRTMCWEAYSTSADLAEERGSFPLFDRDKFLLGYNFASTMLPADIKEKISKKGMRNSHLMTVAPTGTGSIVCGNVSSGGEPVFLHMSRRKVLKPTTGFGDEWEFYDEWGYGAKLYFATAHFKYGAPGQPSAKVEDLPSYMVTAEDLSIQEHVVMQAAAQRWIDSSISKTVNIPKETPYEEFVQVYDLAYSLGCKGCTTYRPSDVRGSVLSKPGDATPPVVGDRLLERPDILDGRTYKVKWPSSTSALYLTVNSTPDGHPFEVFLASKDAKHHDWTTALSVMITAIFRKGGDVSFVGKELQQVQSLNDSAFIGGRNHPSLVAYIGYILEQHIEGSKGSELGVRTYADGRMVIGDLSKDPFKLQAIAVEPIKGGDLVRTVQGEQCPKCFQLTYVRKEGCKVCLTCNHTTCG
jgi:ribonucleoside-diphosphate reductase alpha chain